ncbi:MAG: 5'-nucleotidase C-terminal domain-containing protein [Pseudomonadota bacterium]|nr:5'-nucleotidase C-terminal domain-containing protein [Pseudomonadota bacterium]
MTEDDQGTTGTDEGASDRSELSGRLRVLATSDVHSHLLSYNYYTDQEHPGIGLSRTASLIGAARKEVAESGAITLLVDNGDWLQGSPLAETDAADPDATPASIRAFEVLGYDAVGLGNHEFNFGLPVLARALSALPCPAVCSNITPLADAHALPVHKTLMLRRRVPCAPADAPDVKIGLLSVLPPQTMLWDADHLEGRLRVDDILSSARAAIADLRKAGADVVIALAHTGLGQTDQVAGMENALRPLSHLPGLDAAVSGHTHLLLPAPDGEDAGLGVPVVMPGSSGSHLGVIDLDLIRTPQGWRVTQGDCTLRPVAHQTRDGLVPVVPEAPELVNALSDIHQRTRADMATKVGTLAKPHHSYFTYFGEDRALALTAAAQAAAVRPTLAKSEFADLPLLSAVAPAKFGGRAGPLNYTDVPAGEISRRHVADIYIYPNELRCIIVDAQQLRDWLDMSAGLFNQLEPNAPDRLLANPARAGHNFDVIFGLEYEIDPTAPARFDADGRLLNDAASRIRNLRWQGHPLQPDQRFAVAFNSYRSSGGGNFRMLDQAQALSLPPQMIRDTVGAYVTSTLAADPLAAAPYPWRIRPNLGVEAIAVTGPGVHSHLHELPDDVAQSATELDTGFVALKLQL